jgi:hypothetical protein
MDPAAPRGSVAGAGAQSVGVDLAGGDTIKTTRKGQNPSGDTVSFGEGTADEMCFAFLTSYPKIQSSSFQWVLPASGVLGKCTSTDP